MAKVITDAARALVGVEQSPVTVEVDKSAVQKFAVAIKWPQQPNPLYCDERYGRTTRWGGMIAAATICGGFPWLGELLDKISPTMGKYRVGLNGGNEYEFFAPIRPGDVLAARPKLTNLEEKPRDDGGVMLILSLEAEFSNQLGDKVVTARQTLLRIYGPENLA